MNKLHARVCALRTKCRVLVMAPVRSASLALLTCVSFGCSSTGDAADTPPSDAAPAIEENGGWYNAGVFKPLFGDFNTVGEGINFLDKEAMRKAYEQGGYLTRVAGCGTCHGIKPEDPGSPLAGGFLLRDSFGEVRAANITPDKATGIGTWNISEVVRAMRASINREGRALSVELHNGFRWMSDYDAKAIALYLMAQEPKRNEVERRELSGLARRKWGLISQHREFDGYVPEQPQKATPQYGRYLSMHVAGCARCHSSNFATGSPDDLFTGNESSKGIFESLGALASIIKPDPQSIADKRNNVRSMLSKQGRKKYDEDPSLHKASTIDRVSDNIRSLVKDVTGSSEEKAYVVKDAPNIRGNDEEGLKLWSVEQIVAYLSNGRQPDGTVADPSRCPWGYYSVMSDRDKRAIASFLKTL